MTMIEREPKDAKADHERLIAVLLKWCRNYKWPAPDSKRTSSDDAALKERLRDG